MVKIKLEAEDCTRDGKEFSFRCQCGENLSSVFNLHCPSCGQEYEWPESSRGQKILLRQKAAAEADRKAKERNSKMSETAKTLLEKARIDSVSPVFIRDFLNEEERVRRANGHMILTEMQIIDKTNPELLLSAMEACFAGGDRGRGLIVHTLNKIMSGSSIAKKETSEGNSNGTWL